MTSRFAIWTKVKWVYNLSPNHQIKIQLVSHGEVSVSWVFTNFLRSAWKGMAVIRPRKRPPRLRGRWACCLPGKQLTFLNSSNPSAAPENQWLENPCISYSNSPFLGDMLLVFRGVPEKKTTDVSFMWIILFETKKMYIVSSLLKEFFVKDSLKQKIEGNFLVVWGSLGCNPDPHLDRRPRRWLWPLGEVAWGQGPKFDRFDRSIFFCSKFGGFF